MDLPANYLHTNRNIDNSLSSSTNQVKTPKQQYFEFKYGWVVNQLLNFSKMRSKLKEFQELRNQRRFLTKRERLLKSNWKHGVLGIEGPETPQSEVYKHLNKQKRMSTEIRERRAKARKAIILENSVSFVSLFLGL